jgi:uncharacterized protein
MAIIQDLHKKNLIHPPKWLPDNVHYLTDMGSVAYGTATGDSDVDIYGFCIPPKEDVFPHLRGEILGFGRQVNRFEQWQEHHVVDEDAHGGKGEEYDFTVYSIVKYFQLTAQNNINMLDSLFAPYDCVRHITAIGQMVRDRRWIFLSREAFVKAKGYAFSQLHKMTKKSPESKRYWMIEKYGFDLKFAMHAVRLVCEAEQILTTGDLYLRRDSEMLRSILRGEWTAERIREWFESKERGLESLYNESDAVPYKPDEEKIKQLLLDCLEHHYGSLDAVIYRPERDGQYRGALLSIQSVNYSPLKRGACPWLAAIPTRG